MNKWIEKIRHHPNTLSTIVLVIAVVLAVTIELWQTPKESPKASTPPSADTYIPIGYVLLPVEIENASALSSVIGRHGVVDLFLSTPSKNRKPIRIARRTKILRAPLNPQRFAVLVRENEAERFFVHDQPLIAVVQNPNAPSSVKEVEHRKYLRKIFFENDAEE